MSKMVKSVGDYRGTLDQLRHLSRYKTHGGYTWAAVMSDGGLMCTACVRANYRQIFRATRDGDYTHGWSLTGLTHSGESDDNEVCAHCSETLWDHWRPADVILYLSDARGVYIPRDFAKQTKRECVSGTAWGEPVADLLDQLALGPDECEGYWDVWAMVCDSAVITAPDTGKQYTIYQDGDCWLIEKGAEWDDDEGLDSARIRQP